jgi:hypothetical protein
MVKSDVSLPNCGDFAFLDPSPSDSRKFYDWLFDLGQNAGMMSYEPDFMNQNYNCIPDFQKDVTSAEQWLDGMANAGEARNVI